jgi:hypothetical protein
LLIFDLQPIADERLALDHLGKLVSQGEPQREKQQRVNDPAFAIGHGNKSLGQDE